MRTSVSSVRITLIAACVVLAGAAMPPFVALAQGTTTIGMVIEGGSVPGTYEVKTEAPCNFGSIAPGLWSVDIGDTGTEPIAIHLGFSTARPEDSSLYIAFGDPYSGDLYRSSMSHPVEVSVDDRGDSATLTLTADWLEAYAADGSDLSGASAVVTVECGRVERFGSVETPVPSPDSSLAPPPGPDLDSLPPGTPIATGVVTWTTLETYDDPRVPESSRTTLTMTVDVALYQAGSSWLDAGSRFTIAGTETRADFTWTDASGKTCTMTGYTKSYEGAEAFSGSPWVDTEYQPAIEFAADQVFGAYLKAWGSAGTVATWTEVGDLCDPPGPREETGRVLYAIWCRPSEDRTATSGTLAADGASADFACSYSGSEEVNGGATITEAVTVAGVVQLGTS
jgi:hypothetical protein